MELSISLLEVADPDKRQTTEVNKDCKFYV